MQKFVLFASFAALVAPVAGQVQNAPSVSQVVIYSTLTNRVITQVPSAVNQGFRPSASGTLSQGLLSIYTGTAAATPAGDLSGLNRPTNFQITPQGAAFSNALSANIAVALSAIPVESPTSGVILKTDPSTGALLPVSGTLGPIFTKRAETLGKGRFFIGITHQNYHFKSFNGQSLNGVSLLYGGGEQSGINIPGATTSKATVNLALDIRISQDVAFLTYGVTNRMDVSVGLPMVHAGVTSTAYNGLIYSGSGNGSSTTNRCWCLSTFSPGQLALAAPTIGNSSLSKTGFGDALFRVKQAIVDRPNIVVSVGTDLRLPSGDAKNYLGTGTTSIKPFLSISSYRKGFGRGMILAPHGDIGWQISGKSILGGSLAGTPTSTKLSDGSSVNYFAAPLVNSKNYLPDIFTWAFGTEVALSRKNTIVVDFIGNQIGWIHGIRTLSLGKLDPTKDAPPTLEAAGFAVQAPLGGLTSAGATGSFGQYNGAFGYKSRIYGDLVFSFQVLVRLNNSGLTARATPLFGLGYSF